MHIGIENVCGTHKEPSTMVALRKGSWWGTEEGVIATFHLGPLRLTFCTINKYCFHDKMLSVLKICL